MMKKILFCLVTLLGTGTFYSCQQDEVVNEVLANKSVTIRASLPGDADSRVILGDTGGETTDIYWEEGDEISLTIGSNTYTFTIQDFVANQTTATFTCVDANLPATLEAGTYTFVYGSDADVKEQAGTKEGLSDYHYMAATLEITEATPWSEVNLTFKTQVAIVEIPVPADASASKVSLYNIADGSKIATTATGATIGEYVYFAVPAGDYDGFVLAEKADGNDVHTAYLSSNELVAGNLYRTNELVANVSTTPDPDFKVKYVPLTPGSTTYVFWGIGTSLNETGLGDAIERAIILEGIKVVGEKAFENCTNLASFTLASTVTTIFDYAFSGCTSLTSITLPESVKDLCEGAFKNCENLVSINIPTGVNFFESRLFDGCKSLTSIVIPSDITTVSYRVFADCESLTTVTLPSTINLISDEAFSGCKALTSITLPAGVTSIGLQAFKSCESLASITLPSTISKIKQEAFSGCTNLASINIPAGVTSIEINTFTNCGALTSITLPEGVTKIGYNAFSGCTNLASINIPAGVTIIEQHTFNGCKSLTEIVLPAAVTSIEKYAFNECENLASINIPTGVTSIPEAAFSGCKKLASINIPAGVTSIGSSAFSNTALSSIDLPEGLTNIGNYAFLNSQNLKSVICRATQPPTLGTNVFKYGSWPSYSISVENIKVPNGSVDLYKAATNWSDYADKIEAIVP